MIMNDKALKLMGRNEKKFQMIYGLTNREVQVARLLASELTGQQIASKLFVSLPTVRKDMENMKEKLNVKGKAGIIVFAAKYNLV